MSDKFKFFTELDVLIGDINYGGHKGNERFLISFQEARLRYLKQFGYSELSVGNGAGIIMSQAHINYRAEAFWGDRLKVFVRISKLEKVRFMFEYKIIDAHNDEKLMATGYTEMVSFDFKNRKVKKLPDKFVADIKKYEELE